MRAGFPHAERVRTGNAYSNAPMLAIKDALGFKVIQSKTEWQLDLRELEALSGPRSRFDRVVD